MRARKLPNFDSATFHAQQCVEKYFKARLQEEGVDFPHTHDLVALLNLALPAQPLWAGLKDSANILSQHAVKVRYPGYRVTQSQAKDALSRCRDIRKHVRQSLGLPT